MKFRNAFVILIAIGVPFFAHGEGAKKKTQIKVARKIDLSLDTLKLFDSIKNFAAFQSVTWDSRFGLKYKKDNIFDSKLLCDSIHDGNILNDKPELAQYIDQITSFVTSIGYLNDEISYFVKDEISLPFQLVNYKNSKCIAAYVFGSNTYNTLRFPTAKIRATKMLTQALLPAVRHMGNAFANTDIKYVSFFYVYGTQDFSDRITAAKAEVLNITADIDDVKKFSSNDISSDEFVKKGIILMSDRNSFGSFTKLDLIIE